MAAATLASYAAPAAGAALAYAYADARHGIGFDRVKGNALAYATIGAKWANFRDRNSLWYIFEYTAKRRPNQIAYHFEGQTITWKEAMLYSHRIANWLISQGYKRGDVVAILMFNKPAYPILWLAMLQIGVIPAMLNFNLPAVGLLHCIKTGGGKALLFDADMEDKAAELIKPLAESGTTFIRWQDRASAAPEKYLVDCVTVTEQTTAQQSAELPSIEYRKGTTWQDTSCLIYTSGTTGLPKAASCTHGRLAIAFRAWSVIEGITQSDVIYTAMPIYHSTALFLGVGVCWVTGATLAIGRRFSATKFFDEVRSANATVIQYVGEVPRYLLATPPSPKDTDHRVRMAYGNGCRPDVWNKFRDRFNVPIISEFFAATEGTTALFNVNSGPYGAGAVGHEGLLQGIIRKKDQALIRLDAITEEPLRNKKGFCERVATDEPGELIVSIDMSHPVKAFKGYHGNEAATKKKIMHDVFAKGDAWFRMGDLLRKDGDGFIYFSDRLGDTFRWRSENVSTTEVATVMGDLVDEANVYGILVPLHDGRAGCAAIPANNVVDLAALGKHVTAKLPRYARPLFLRFVKQLDTTGTNKQQKVALRTEGVDPGLVKDPLYWLQNDTYKPFTKEDWAAIKQGKVKL